MQSFEFLAGPNPEFEFIKGQILSRDALPSLEQIYSLVQSEYSRQKAISNPLPQIDHSALAISTRFKDV